MIKDRFTKAQEIADKMIPFEDNTLLSRIDEAMNKGLKWGIVYFAQELSKFLTDSDDVDDIISAYRDMETKIKEFLK